MVGVCVTVAVFVIVADAVLVRVGVEVGNAASVETVQPLAKVMLTPKVAPDTPIGQLLERPKRTANVSVPDTVAVLVPDQSVFEALLLVYVPPVSDAEFRRKTSTASIDTESI